MKVKNIVKNSFIVIVCLLLVLFFIYSINNRKNYASNDNKYKILDEIGNLVDEKFLYDVDSEKMINNAIKGYVAGLDDKYASYYTPEEFKEFIQNREGKYYGIGITMVYDKERNMYKIEYVNKGYGADDAGVKEGSYISKIDGTVVTVENINTLITQIKKSNPGTIVKLTLLVDGIEKLFDVEVREVKKSIVISEKIDNSVYIKISEFDEQTHTQLINELKKYEKFNGIIIDLRNNPGGDLQSVIDVSSEFINEKLLTYTVDKNNKKVVYNTVNTHRYANIPIVLIVNENTASASELFTGAVRAYNRGTIIGKNTFGKGVVQEIMPLSNGGGFKQTIAKYYTPDDKNIDGIGIAPDIEIEPSDISLPLKNQDEIIKALEILSNN